MSKIKEIKMRIDDFAVLVSKHEGLKKQVQAW